MEVLNVDINVQKIGSRSQISIKPIAIHESILPRRLNAGCAALNFVTVVFVPIADSYARFRNSLMKTRLNAMFRLRRITITADAEEKLSSPKARRYMYSAITSVARTGPPPVRG
jgi:hypothetical protein